MATKNKPGRPRKKKADKVKVASAYLTDTELKKIKNKYETLNDAIREEILPKCG